MHDLKHILFKENYFHTMCPSSVPKKKNNSAQIDKTLARDPTLSVLCLSYKCPAGVLGQLLVYAKAYSQPQYVTNIRGNYGIDHIDPHTLASETT